MKIVNLMNMLLLAMTFCLKGQVDTIIIINETGMDITALIEYVDHSTARYTVEVGEKKPIYTEEQCIYGISIYSGRWDRVSEIEPDDKLVIPVGWNRCQGWQFTIRKRIDGTIHVANKKSIQAQEKDSAKQAQVKAGT